MKKLIVFFLIIGLTYPVSSAFAINAVASIKAVSGEVKIQRFKRSIPGRRGLVLNDQDVVITGHQAKTTILFRDGSEIRLFQDSTFTIEKSEEMEGGQRGFLHDFILKAGAFWGKFTRNRQQTKISTPTATCGIKGTAVSFSQRDGKLDVSLSSGIIELENEDEKIQLQAGKMVNGITRTGSLQNKVQDLPYRLEMKPDSSEIEIPTEGNVNSIDFTIQIVNVKTRQNVNRSGEVFFSLRTDKIEFPQNVYLNSRGYARVTAKIKPFQKGDYEDGKLEITAVTEGEQNMDIGSAQSILTYRIPQKFQRTISIDAGSGQIN